MDCSICHQKIKIATFLAICIISIACFGQTDTTKQIKDSLPSNNVVTASPVLSDQKHDSIQPLTKADTSRPQNVIAPEPVQPTPENPNKPAITPKLGNIQAAADTMRLDTIIKKSGGKMRVKIEGKNLFEILFKMPGQKITKKMSTSSIREIRYANGKIEVLDNNPEKRPKDWIPPVSEVEYSKITIAKDESEIGTLIEMGKLEAIYESKKMMTENSFLEKNALIILRKKAVALKATTILVTFKEITRQYGEYPSITMKATAYGSGNPPSEE